MAEDRTRAENLTCCTEECETECETESDANTVEERCYRIVLASETFSTTENDTVYHDERDKETETLVEVRHVSLDDHLKDCHERRNDYDENRYAHHVRCELLDARDDDV